MANKQVAQPGCSSGLPVTIRLSFEAGVDRCLYCAEMLRSWLLVMFTRAMLLGGLTFYLSALCINGWATLDETIAKLRTLAEGGKKIAVLIIDVQPAFLPVFNSDESETLNRQVELLHALNDTENIYFIDINYVAEDRNFGPTLSGLKEAAMRSRKYSLFHKTGDSAFQGYDYYDSIYLPEDKHGDITPEDAYFVLSDTFNGRLKKMGIDQIVPTGCFDGACVLRTSRDALENGYSVIIDHDLTVRDDIRDEDWPGRLTRKGRANACLRICEGQWQELEAKYPEKLTRLNKKPVAQSTCIIL